MNEAKLLGRRLRALRKARKLSQYQFKQRTALLQPYISRIENGRNTPSVESLQKMAYALGVPLYKLFCDGQKPPRQRRHLNLKRDSGGEPPYFDEFCKLLARIGESDRKLLLKVAQKMARRSKVIL